MGLVSGCGGSPPAVPQDKTQAPLTAPVLRFEVIPGLSSGGADLIATGMSGVEAYAFEVGSTPGGADLGRFEGTSPIVRASNLPLKGTSYARVRARRGTEVSGASQEVAIVTLDLRDVIDAAFFGNGPLVPRGTARCPEVRSLSECQNVAWREFPDTAVRLILSSSLDPAARPLLVEGARQLGSAGGRIQVVVADGGGILEWVSASPPPSTVFVGTGDIPTSGGSFACTWPSTCLTTVNAGALPDRVYSAFSIWGVGTSPRAYLRGAIAGGIMRLGRLDSVAIGGAAQSLMASGSEVQPCSSGAPECLPDHITALDLTVWIAVQRSGLPSGATRRQFEAIGLVPRL